MQQWEYISMAQAEPLARDVLNQQGNEGWELVSVVHHQPNITQAGILLYVFKRPRR